ncbi:MAG: carboxypeptidase regulatory-like domain-containing protein [Acidobacteria bacterium]|nr:carboxypeptidase regulatory-like domain-containing protein [Acidobacteriota bacterium]
MTSVRIRLLLLASGSALVAFAQQGRGTILGTVTDSSGAAVAGARVGITHIATNVTFQTLTNQEGFYSSPPLNVGSYTVTAEQQGFKKAVRSGIVLEVDQRPAINMTLEVGAVTEQIEVMAVAALVETTTGALGKVVENRRVQELPLNGRSALALTLLTPSVKSNAGPTNSGFGDRGIQISSLSINGGPNSMNGLLLDGGNNIQAYIGEVNINPAVDAVEEFKVQSGSMSAEYGFTGGGIINVVTKSGANQIHGSVYEFLRNDKLDARNTFAATKPPFRYNQYGAAAGGRVIRDRMFYFGNWEEYRFARADNRIGTFPTAGQRNGNFTDLLDTTGRLIPVYDPATTRANPSGAGFVRDPFAGNIIPANRIDPVSKAINEFYPLPNRTPTDRFTNANNYARLGTESRLMRQFTVRLDHRFSDKNSLFGRFSYFQHSTDNGASGATVYPNDVVAKRDDNLQNKNLILNDTHTFTPTLINEFRIGFARQLFPFVVRSFGGGWPQKLGLPASVPADTFPGISNGLPGFNTGTAGVRGSVYWQFFDMVTKIHGSHTWKLGIDQRLLRGNNFQRSSPSGSFNFAAALTGNPQSPAGTGSSYATFLAGAVSSASVTTHLGESQHGISTSAFFQDDWKVSRRLTLNFGLRWDFQQQPLERWNGATNFDPTAPIPGVGLLGRTVYAGRDGQPRSFRDNDYNDFGPRAGFALDIFGNQKTVLRGGYGLYYPYQFWRQNFGNPTGFANTSTTYSPPGNNTNLPAFQFSAGLPSPPIQPQGANLGPAPFLGQNVEWDERAGTTPMSHQWSVSLQRQLPGYFLVDATYSANVGNHFTANSYEFNAIDPSQLSLGLGLQELVDNPYAGRVPGALGAARVAREQTLKPFPYYNSVTVRFPRIGSFNSHQLLLSVEKRMSHGLAMLFSYTSGKIISDSLRNPVDFGSVEQTNFWNFQNGRYNRRAERSVDPTDVSQRGALSLVYELPFGRGKRLVNSGVASQIAGGWQVNTVGVMQTGVPVVVTGASNFRADRPNSTGASARLDGDQRSRNRWFDTTQFANPPNFTFGNIGRALPDVRGPGTVNWDFSVIKNTRVTERVNLQFRAESFNFLNHVNLGLPNGGFVAGPDGRNRSGTFGTITSARDARVNQLALKLVF